MTHLLRLHFAWRSLALSLYGMEDGLEKKILTCYNWRGCRRSDGRTSGSYQKCKLASWELRQTVEDIRYVITNHSEEQVEFDWVFDRDRNYIAPFMVMVIMVRGCILCTHNIYNFYTRYINLKLCICSSQKKKTVYMFYIKKYMRINNFSNNKFKSPLIQVFTF